MIMKKMLIVLAILIFASVAYAQESVEGVHNMMLDQLSPYLGRDLGTAGKVYGNEDVNFYLTDGTLIGYVRTRKGIFEKFGEGKIKEPTMEVYIEGVAVIKELSESLKKIDTFYKLKKAGKIKIKPVGFGKKTKYAFANSLGHLANIFV